MMMMICSDDDDDDGSDDDDDDDDDDGSDDIASVFAMCYTLKLDSYTSLLRSVVYISLS